jgi:hypothetical protein
MPSPSKKELDAETQSLMRMYYRIARMPFWWPRESDL